MAQRKSDLYAFVAGDAVEACKRSGTVFQVKCNCGGEVPLLVGQPLRCLACLRSIGVLVLDGDPGYVVGSVDGTPALLPVQGSQAPPLSSLSVEERERMLQQAIRNLPKAAATEAPDE